MSEGSIMEGFLCPICMKDLGSVTNLQKHFEDSHSAEDKDVLQSVKGVFEKAKRKILSQDLMNEEVERSRGYDPMIFEPQEPGAFRRHTNYFKKMRDLKTDRYAAETNKLLIRLNKLIQDIPSDPAKRKAHERSVVPWLDETDVNLCPNCACSFNVARRKHHCRLCGSIMCQSCSRFLPIHVAKQVTFSDEESKSPRRGKVLKKFSLDSLESVISLIQESRQADPHIRVCIHCAKLLEHRDEQISTYKSEPVLLDLYNQVIVKQTQVSDTLPLYLQMVNSLKQGEAHYELREAQDKRIHMLKVAEDIEYLSKKIEGLSTESPGTKQLQQKIRMRAMHFLKDKLIGIPETPEEEELEKLQHSHRTAVVKRIEAEKQRAVEYNQVKSKATDTTNILKSKKVLVGAGWGPGHVETVSNAKDDPLLQQIHIIRNYIQQARSANREDEAVMLEHNLRELKEEYRKQTAS